MRLLFATLVLAACLAVAYFRSEGTLGLPEMNMPSSGAPAPAPATPAGTSSFKL